MDGGPSERAGPVDLGSAEGAVWVGALALLSQHPQAPFLVWPGALANVMCLQSSRFRAQYSGRGGRGGVEEYEERTISSLSTFSSLFPHL